MERTSSAGTRGGGQKRRNPKRGCLSWDLEHSRSYGGGSQEGPSLVVSEDAMEVRVRWDVEKSAKGGRLRLRKGCCQATVT